MRLSIAPLARMTPLILLIAALSGAGCSGQSRSDSEAPAGLQAQRSTLDSLFVAPEADFSRYQSIYIQPLEIHYDPSPRQDSLRRGRDAFQLDERQRAQLQQQYERAVTAVWSEQPGWTQVSEPGPGVLILRSTLKDYYLYASLRNDHAEPNRTLAGESSRFTLQAQLLDGGSGELLLQSEDHRVTGDRNIGASGLRPFSSVRYWSDFYQDINSWARQLRSGFQ